jgi:hypothetical protein
MVNKWFPLLVWHWQSAQLNGLLMEFIPLVIYAAMALYAATARFMSTLVSTWW